MKKLFILLLVLSMSSCKLLKNINKKENSSKEEILTKTTRVGDTVTFMVPRVIYKDTTITTVNRVGTRIETRYDDQGNIDLIECFSSNIDELRQEMRELHSREKEKVEEAEPDKWFWFLIILAAGAVLIVVKKI